MTQYLSDGPTQSSSTTSETSWDLPEVDVDREVSLDGEAARFTVTVRNDDSQPHDVDLRYLLDYQVADQDGAPVFVQGNVYTNERRFEDPSFTRNLTYDRIPDPNLTGVMTNDGQPDFIDFVYWENAFQEPYGYTPDPSVNFHTPGATSYPASDSAGVLTWELGELESGEERTVTVFYGIGEPQQTAIDDFDSALESSGADISPDLLCTKSPTEAGTEVHCHLTESEGIDRVVIQSGNSQLLVDDTPPYEFTINERELESVAGEKQFTVVLQDEDGTMIRRYTRRLSMIEEG